MIILSNSYRPLHTEADSSCVTNQTEEIVIPSATLSAASSSLPVSAAAASAPTEEKSIEEYEAEIALHKAKEIALEQESEALRQELEILKPKLEATSLMISALKSPATATASVTKTSLLSRLKKKETTSPNSAAAGKQVVNIKHMTTDQEQIILQHVTTMARVEEIVARLRAIAEECTAEEAWQMALKQEACERLKELKPQLEAEEARRENAKAQKEREMALIEEGRRLQAEGREEVEAARAKMRQQLPTMIKAVNQLLTKVKSGDTLTTERINVLLKRTTELETMIDNASGTDLKKESGLLKDEFNAIKTLLQYQPSKA